jgi:DNA-binding NarL/FixJ family response regulator
MDEVDLRDGPIRILLCDDSADIRALLRTWLELGGRFHVADEVATGDEVVASVVEHQPDEVVLDLAMPGLDGFSVIPEILRRSPHTKILVLSAFTSPTMRRKAYALGAHAVLVKGVPMEEVEDMLVRLDSRPALPALSGSAPT